MHRSKLVEESYEAARQVPSWVAAPNMVCPDARALGHSLDCPAPGTRSPSSSPWPCRDAIYRRHGVSEPLSIAEPQADGSVLAVNLYHHEHQGAFAAGELTNFEHLSVGLLATVRRHIELVQAPLSPRPDGARLRAALQRRHHGMPERELDVCERLLLSLSYDGSATDLGLSLATVKTYRRRAFQRMGLHFKSERFAAFVGQG